MPKASKSIQDVSLLTAALEGLELQRQRIDEQIRLVRARLGKRSGKAAGDALPGKRAKKRILSPAARKRIALAQKRRWAEYRKKKSPSGPKES